MHSQTQPNAAAIVVENIVVVVADVCGLDGIAMNNTARFKAQFVRTCAWTAHTHTHLLELAKHYTASKSDTNGCGHNNKGIVADADAAPR